MNKRGPRRVLNAGSGRLHGGLDGKDWTEVRFDIDPRGAPDLFGSLSDMRGLIDDGIFDVLWSSHGIEPLHAHVVAPAFREFTRVLKADGFALVTCPDIGAIARFLTREGLEAVACNSPTGPIRPLDMLYGHAPWMAAGRACMTHNAGLTAERLGRVATEAGFAEMRVIEGSTLDLWAALLMPRARLVEIAAPFGGTEVADCSWRPRSQAAKHLIPRSVSIRHSPAIVERPSRALLASARWIGGIQLLSEDLAAGASAW